ncbi:hypothetical protein L195_g016485, partial [Trifolium pratense]
MRKRSVNGLNPSETTSILHVELNVASSRKPVSKSIIQVKPIFQKTLEKSIYVFVIVDDANKPTKLIFDNLIDSVVTPNVESNVVTSVKGYVSSNVVGSVDTSVRSASEIVILDKPRSLKTIGQSSMNIVVVDGIVFEIFHVSKVVDSVTLSSLTKVVVVSPKETSPESDVVSDVETSWTNMLIILMAVWSIESLNVVEENDSDDFPLDQAIAQSVTEIELYMGVYLSLCALKEIEAMRNANVLVAAASQSKGDIGSVVDKPKQIVPEKDVVPDVDTS